MFKSLALFAANYLLDISVLHLIPLAAVATHFHWVYPLVAAISAAFTLAITRYARPLAFSLAALPLVYLLSFGCTVAGLIIALLAMRQWRFRVSYWV